MMRTEGRAIVAFGGGILTAGGAAAAQEDPDLGRITYRIHRSIFHGPMAPVLSVKAPGLTTIQAKNGGVYPFARVSGIIGRGGEGINGAAAIQQP